MLVRWNNVWALILSQTSHSVAPEQAGVVDGIPSMPIYDPI